MFVIGEDESFSLTANVSASGPQRIALTGYLVSQRSDGTYVAPLIPQLFYGASGTQLQTWRQDLTQTGSQVILSRVGGKPYVPPGELYWRKVAEPTEEKVAEVPTAPERANLLPIAILAGIALLLTLTS